MRIVVVGAGLIGREHVTRLLHRPRVAEVIVVDPTVAARADRPAELTHSRVRMETDLATATAVADGAVVATPNAVHVEPAAALLEAGVPVLVEKPLADRESAARRLVDLADETGVPLLVGHHRRYSAALSQARAVVESGALGDMVAVTGSALFAKPAEYFADAPWRTRAGGGPLLINLVHDMDALRWLAGEIVRVRAVSSNHARGFEVEDTAALILEFASGALGSFLLSDAAASHRSWEQSSGENPSYDRDRAADSYHLAGRTGSLSVPTLRLTTADGEPSWWTEARKSRIAIQEAEPLEAQAEHFLDVVEGVAPPRVSARDGLQALRIVLAASASAAAGGSPVSIPAPPDLPARVPVGSGAAAVKDTRDRGTAAAGEQRGGAE